MTKSVVKRGIQYEKQKAMAQGAKYVGGPEKPDYKRRFVKEEVKNKKPPGAKPELRAKVFSKK